MGGRGGGASAHSFIGDSYNPARLQSEGEKEAAAADRKFLRREWADVNRRAHWLLSGAQPMDHSNATLQGILGHSIDVTSEVHDMIATLNGFKVRAFAAQATKLKAEGTQMSETSAGSGAEQTLDQKILSNKCPDAILLNAAAKTSIRTSPRS